ncbi:MAG: hypothetical protein ACYC8T_03530 [Myxococcaceae bacterium]
MSPDAKARQYRPTRLLMPRASAGPSSAASGECGWPERLALFACALARESAIDLLEGLAEPQRARAREFARKVASWDSPTRQAKVAVEFGPRPDAGGRLRALMAEAGPTLRRELFRLLPPYHRSLFPELVAVLSAPGDPPPPGLLALAQRLVREATR